MTVSTAASRTQANGNGSTSAFPFAFSYSAKSQIQVVVTSAAGVDSTKILDTHFSLTDPGDSGTVTFFSSPVDYRPQSGEKVTISRVLPIEQSDDFVNGQGFNSATIEAALDRITRIEQMLAERISRAPKLKATTTTGELTLPEPSASAYLGWNAGGTDLMNVSATIPSASVSPYMATVLDDANSTAALATLGAQPLDSDLTAIAALSTTTYGRALLERADDAALQAYIGVREVLTSDRTYYVRTDGSDSNTGLVDSAGGAFLTLQHAYNVIAHLIDCAGFNVTIDVGDGTYTAGIDAITPITGQGIVNIVGNAGTPANVIINPTNAHGILNRTGSTIIQVSGIEFRTTTAGACLWAWKNSGIIVAGAIRFGASAGDHFLASEGGLIEINANYTVAGGAVNHWHAYDGGMIICQNRTITLSGTPAFSGNFCGNATAIHYVTGNTFSGSATGSRYLIHKNGYVDTGSGTPETYFPGSVAGTRTGGGVLDNVEGTLASNSYFEAAEIAAPSSPAADKLRVYAKDVGGITRLATLNSAGTELVVGGITVGTAQTTTGGAAINFTSLPPAIKRITVMFNEVSLSGTDNILVQIGDSGGLETTGYSSGSSIGIASTVAQASSTAGFIVIVGNASRNVTGHMVLTRITGNTWVASHSMGSSVNAALAMHGGGSKALSDELDRLTVTVTGANTIDANGGINISVEL